MHSSSFSSPSSDPDLRIFLLAAAGVIVFMVVFFYFCHPYDLATGMFYAFSLGLMARGRLLQYLGVFALANVNRETTILLILVFALYFLSRLPWRRYLLLMLGQILIFMVIRAFLTSLYAGNPGVDAWIDPTQNLRWFLEYPWLSLVHWGAFVLIAWRIVRRWHATPRLLQLAVVVLGPILLVLYLVAGRAFEIRVFAELYPAVWVMLTNRNLFVSPGT